MGRVPRYRIKYRPVLQGTMRRRKPSEIVTRTTKPDPRGLQHVKRIG